MDILFSAGNAPYLWLAAGALFLAAEAFGVPGVGFLFAGLGAIATGILIDLEAMGTGGTPGQFAWFFATSVAWTALLWKPLKKFRAGGGKDGGDYNNMVGGAATVTGGPLRKGKTGKVAWSGTTMQAELAADAAVDEMPEGGEAVIREVKGTKLIVAPKE